MTAPNVDSLAPGSINELYSFDHDVGAFIATGTAVASEDGSVLTSQAGTGILKGGWMTFGQALPVGTVANCPECQKCVGVSCLLDPAKDRQQCTKDTDACTADFCGQGNCKHVKMIFRERDIESADNFRITPDPRMPAPRLRCYSSWALVSSNRTR